jgi:3'(2'), 5'-bisphosphate nucleotidase
MSDPLRQVAETARDLVRSAGDLILGMQDSVTARDKGRGRGPVTEADFAAEEVLIEGLKQRYPDAAILSEETNPVLDRSAKRLWCIDPLDGTREYADGRGEWAVMMGLLVDGEPAAGAFSVPAEGLVFWGWRGGGAFSLDGSVSLDPLSDIAKATVIHSRSHQSPALQEALKRLQVGASIKAGSVGYKVAQMLAGKAQLYIHPRGGTKWWDSVAPAAVLRSAGGFVSTAKGEPLVYSQDTRHNDGLFFSTPALAPEALSRLSM